MTKGLNVTISAWSAWAPGIDSQEKWRIWASEAFINNEYNETINVAFMPAILRRRLSQLSKMALKVASDCHPTNTPIQSIFCSRHGELFRSTELLQDLALKQPLSPTKFSLSVHNAASGLWSIMKQDVSPTLAVSSNTSTFSTSLMQAAAMLHAKAASQVLLVYYDEPIVAPFDQYSCQTEMPHALALLITMEEIGQAINLSLHANDQQPSTQLQQSLCFLKFLLAPHKHAKMTVVDPRLIWTWQHQC